jgi:hypothetical protein
MPVVKQIWEAPTFELLLVLDKSKVSSCDGMDECDVSVKTKFLFVGYRKGNTNTET